MYDPFTQHQQAIPSPWGMPAFEIVDVINPADFFINYDNFESITTPDFTGDRVHSYLRLRNIATHVGYLSRAFPSPAQNETYFEQCLVEFNIEALSSFQRKVIGSEGRRLVNSANSFAQKTILKWNTNANNESLTVFLGLIGIDESASKECGAITLDLLLCAGVLIDDEDGI